MNWPPNDPEIHAALEAAWRDGSWGRYDGPHGRRLEELLSELHEVEFVYPCASGTFGVELALRSVGVEAGTEVLLAGYDFAGNFRAIEAIGASPVLADIEPDTWCLSTDELEAAFRAGNVRAVIVSHLHSGLADMTTICQLASRYNVAVVEDACQATGATVQGRVAGTWGDVGVLSFGGSKLLTAGRGGAIFTRRADIYQRAKIFCERGNHAYPLSELQAAVLAPQFATLSARNRQRSASVQTILAALADEPDLRPVTNPQERGSPSYFKLAWRLASLTTTRTRNQFLEQAQQCRIDMGEGFRGFARRGPRRCRRLGDLTHSLTAAEQTILLHHPQLLGDALQIDQLAINLRMAVTQWKNGGA